jgi:hypothetical protein
MDSSILFPCECMVANNLDSSARLMRCNKNYYTTIVCLILQMWSLSLCILLFVWLPKF